LPVVRVAPRAAGATVTVPRHHQRTASIAPASGGHNVREGTRARQRR
jgi:hypothetical protein